MERPQGVTFQEPGFVRAQVMRATWLGSRVEYRLAMRWGELTATMADQDALLPTGSTVGLALVQGSGRLAGGYFFSFR
jgi:hypothetical protein